MEIKRYEAGALGTSCYLLISENEAVLIDPGIYLDLIAKEIKVNDLILKYIVNTHGHIDHIMGNNDFKSKLGGKLLIHEEDKEMLSSPAENLSTLPGLTPFKSVDADGVLREGDRIKFGSVELEVYHTPGHTKGSICLLNSEEQVLFTGDTLFAYSIGRSDFPHSSSQDLEESLEKLVKLAANYPDLKIYPGHGVPVEYSRVQEINPFIKRIELRNLGDD